VGCCVGIAVVVGEEVFPGLFRSGAGADYAVADHFVAGADVSGLGGIGIVGRDLQRLIDVVLFGDRRVGGGEFWDLFDHVRLGVELHAAGVFYGDVKGAKDQCGALEVDGRAATDSGDLDMSAGIVGHVEIHLRKNF